jgi:predicted Zn-dependent protease
MTRLGLIGLLLLALTVPAGCKSLDEQDMDAIATVLGATARASRPISDSEEYYVGRAVAARILSTYPLLQDRRLTGYVNLVGQTVALHSDKPQTYNGYHFAVLDSTEINAFACPGGTIFITKGMLKEVRNEEELAAVLAHEVAHINERHGIEAIKKARWTEALTVIGTTAAEQYGSRDLQRLVDLFEGSIDDVFKTLVVNGYGQGQELEADRGALNYVTRAGYSPRGLLDFLTRLHAKQRGARGGSILSTHPGMDRRIEQARRQMPPSRMRESLVEKRTRRFASRVTF